MSGENDTTREPGQPGDGNAANRVITVAGKGKERYTIAEAATVLRCDAKWLSNHCGTGDIENVKDKGITTAGHNGIVRYIPRAEVARLAAETPWEASKARGAAKRRPAATKAAKRAANPESAARRLLDMPVAKRRAILRKQAKAAAQDGYLGQFDVAPANDIVETARKLRDRCLERIALYQRVVENVDQVMKLLA